MATSERTANSTRQRSNGHASNGDAPAGASSGDPVVAGPAGGGRAAPDIDGVETTEWLDGVDGVIAADGPERAKELLTRVIERAQHAGTGPIASLSTAYVNTIP